MFVLSVAEAENHEEDWAQENEANAEAGGLAKGLGKFDVHDNAEHEASERDNGKEAKHRFHVQNLEKGVSVINRNESFPAVFTSLLKDFPLGDNDKNIASDGAENEENAEEAGKDPRAHGRSRVWVISIS